MNSVQIRQARIGDEKILADMQTASWKDAFAGILSPESLEKYTDVQATTEMYAHVLQGNFANGSILFVDEAPHCMAFWSQCRENPSVNAAELICIHSLRNNWGKGYGSAMMEHILNEIRQAGYPSVILWVFAENVRARRFYEKHGFVLAEKTKFTYDAAEVMYRKQL